METEQRTFFDKNGNEVVVDVPKRKERNNSGCLKWAVIIIGALVLLGFCGAILGDSGEEPEEETIEQTEQVSIEEKEETEDVIGEVGAEDSKEDDEEEVLRLEAINQAIDEHLDENKSFALGTHESSTEANSSFAYSLYITSLEYDGSALKMQTDEGFMDLSDEEKTHVANSAQNVANVVIGSHEDWEPEEYTKRKFLSVFNGEKVLGRSKILDNREFSWD